MEEVTKVVVLGIDGLDIDKAKKWQDNILLKEHQAMSLDSFALLRTWFIWPTMFSGDKPQERGFDDPQTERVNRAKWDNSLINYASIVASNIFPHSARRKIGSFLTEYGASTNNPSSQKPQRSLFESDCVFTSLKSRVIEVPGWNRGELDIKFNKEGAWSEVIECDDGVERFIEAIEEEKAVKRNLTLEAIDHPYDLIWTHFHFLDAVQHFFNEPEQRKWYSVASEIVQDVIEAADEQTAVVVLSDHGLDTGHREPALVAVEDKNLLPLPERPKEVRPWIEDILSESVEATEETLQDLEALGYRDFVNT